MILPLGDSPNPRGVPFVTYGLIAVNVAVFAFVTLPLSGSTADPNDPALLEYLRVLVQVRGGPLRVDLALREFSAYDLFVFEHGFRPAAPRLLALLSSLFLHAGFAHLFGNMLFLWIYGDNVEHRLGRLRYLLAYLGAGATATLFHAAFNRDSPLPLVGASGAISGILGFYCLWFPRNQVRLLVFLFPFLVDVVTVPARVLLGFYVIVDNLLPFLLARADGGGVAHGAHIGGFLAGLLAARFLDRREVRVVPGAFRPAGPPSGTPRSALREALEDRRFTEAARIYFGLDPDDSRGVLAADESLALGDWLNRHGDPRAALVVYRRHLRDHPRDPTAAVAHLEAGLIQLETFGQAAAAYHHFLDALDLNPSPELAARVRAALDDVAARQKFQVRTARGRSR